MIITKSINAGEMAIGQEAAFSTKEKGAGRYTLPILRARGTFERDQGLGIVR
ncbi:hypothetical protein KSC_101300 [Ktedonobacter sp. SOSP1-52]|uniref:hypothetical protein n=1 Tax=Ktedonobacter sp. SOSP1-52 TaxID=2778366 RepID=UPI0019155936|nr:hypothetical protein [Ktedonobacter sp. SOSP1-52]GHO71238.1 hypothetical protein KSC_101300 [Ktedonobacter sp. SOSP1-52]